MTNAEQSQQTLFLLPHESDALDRKRRRVEWARNFQRAEWPAAAEVSETHSAELGWICPACGELEPTAFTLSINHGIDPDRPQTWSRLNSCIKTMGAQR